MNCTRMNHCQDEDEKRLELIIDHKWHDKKVIKWKYVNSLDNLDLLKEFEPLHKFYVYRRFDIELKPKSIFEINGFKYKYSISFAHNYGIPTLYFEKDLMKKWPMELHKYCVELFGTTPDLEMIMNLNDSSDLHESQTIKDLYLHNSYENVDVMIAEEFFEQTDIQSLSVRSQRLTGFVSDDSKLWNIPNLYIPSNWIHARQLTRFAGKNALIDSYGSTIPTDNTQDLNAFLEHWLNSDNTNLETMIVNGYCRRTEGLFDGIKTSKWDPEKRPARYVSNGFRFERVWEQDFRGLCGFSNISFWPDYLDCMDAYDIVRESDGLIASVKVEHGIFFMFVWHSRYL
ncbi:unnamed protein product [Caenorhabditis nigoni]